MGGSSRARMANLRMVNSGGDKVRFLLMGIAIGMAVGVTVVADAQSAPDPFVSAVNGKQDEDARALYTLTHNSGTFGEQIVRDHQVIGDQAKQINDLTKQLADLKAKTPPAAAEPEKK